MEKLSPFRPSVALTITLALVVVFTSQVQSANLIKRSIAPPKEPAGPCRLNGVCGWEVYDSYTRSVEYYVMSSCTCTPEDDCQRVDDDISISAWVYRCRPKRNRNRTNRTTTRPNTNATV